MKYLEQDLAIRQQLGDKAGEAETCWNIGLTYQNIGDLAKAEDDISRAVQIAETIGHPALEGVRAILNIRWQFWLYKREKTLLNWLRALRRGRQGRILYFSYIIDRYIQSDHKNRPYALPPIPCPVGRTYVSALFASIPGRHAGLPLQRPVSTPPLHVALLAPVKTTDALL